MTDAWNATALTTDAEMNLKVAYPHPRADVERAKVAVAMRRHLRVWRGRKDSQCSPTQPQQYEADQVLEDQQPYLGCLDSWDAWQHWRDVVVDRYEEQGDQCPLGSLFLHLGRSTPGARAIVIELMHRWQASLAAGIRALQAAGHLPADLDVEHRAAALLAGIQGGVSILQSTGRPDHLRAALDQGIDDLRRAAA